MLLLASLLLMNSQTVPGIPAAAVVPAITDVPVVVGIPPRCSWLPYFCQHLLSLLLSTVLLFRIPLTEGIYIGVTALLVIMSLPLVYSSAA